MSLTPLAALSILRLMWRMGGSRITEAPTTVWHASSSDESRVTCTKSIIEGFNRLENMWDNWKSRGAGKNVTTFGLFIHFTSA